MTGQRVILILALIGACLALVEAEKIEFTVVGGEYVVTYKKNDETCTLQQLVDQFMDEFVGHRTPTARLHTNFGLLDLDLKKTLKQAGVKDGSILRLKFGKRGETAREFLSAVFLE